jgi:hypothetical protein
LIDWLSQIGHRVAFAKAKAEETVFMGIDHIKVVSSQGIGCDGGEVGNAALALAGPELETVGNAALGLAGPEYIWFLKAAIRSDATEKN